MGLALQRLGVIPRLILTALPLLVAAAFVALVSLYGVAAIKHWQVRGVVTSSMAPEIDRGALVVIVPPVHPLAVRSVVAFQDPFDPSRTVVHRVIEVIHTPAGILYRTKGDANAQPDPRPLRSDEVVGRVGWSAPYVGGWVAWMRSFPGLIVVLGLPLTAVVVDSAWRRHRQRPGPNSRVT